MQTSDVENLNKDIAHYFQRYFSNTAIDSQTKLTALGFESIDYIELAAFFLKKTNKWINIAEINRHTTVASIATLLLELHTEEPHHTMVQLDKFQQFPYSSQLNGDTTSNPAYIIYHLQLKEPIDIPKLKKAISDTSSNHFMLNCRLRRINDDFFFEPCSIQSDFHFKGSFLFPKNDLKKLTIRPQSNRLVNIYLQKGKKHYYLIISFHHAAIDGWSQKIVLEEIFRRYNGHYHVPTQNKPEEIKALNQIFPASIKEHSNLAELKALLKPVVPEQYNLLSHLFNGELQPAFNCLIFTKEEMDKYADAHQIKAPYNVLFTFMYHQIISQISGQHRLMIHTTLSNRHLPIPGITQLVTNIPTALPMFLDDSRVKPPEFATKINEIMTIYFKNMSYGAISRALLENDTVLNEYLSFYRHSFALIFTYINNTSKLIYGSDSILSQHINWQQSRCHVNSGGKKVFMDIHRLGNEFVMNIHSRMLKGTHQAMLYHYFEVHFPEKLSQLNPP